MNGDTIIGLPSMPAYSKPVAVVVLDPLGLEFIIEHLPSDDAMTKDLIKLRERASEYLWRDACDSDR